MVNNDHYAMTIRYVYGIIKKDITMMAISFY